MPKFMTIEAFNFGKIFLLASFLWSLLFSKNSVSAFHIVKGVSFPWIFEIIWSHTPYNIIILALDTYFFHWARLCAPYACGFVVGIMIQVLSLMETYLDDSS